MRAMKDSGVPWIGEIPEGWEVEKFKARFSFGRGLPITKENLVDEGIPVISYGQIHAKSNSGVHINDDLVRYVTPDYLKTHSDSLVKLGDIIFADTSEDHDGVGNCIFIDRNDNIFAGYHTIIARSNDKCNYFVYQFQTDGWRSQMRSIVSGIKVFSITQRNLKETRVIVPPAHTQQRIAAYLDTQCARIDATIANIRSLIAKLKEYKQSVITEAVTKGLDPDVPMKDSGVPWIGEIPEGWEVTRLKHCCIINPSVQLETYQGNIEVTFLPMDNIKNGYFIENTRAISEFNSGYNLFENDDILLAKVTPCFENGNIAIAHDLVYGVGYGTSEIFVIRAITIETKFIYYFLQSHIFRERAISTMYGTGGLKRVDPYFLRNEKFALPQLSEQKSIISYLDTQCAKIDTALARQEELLTKLEAYKKSLIYECVTGKREVPASA